MVARVSMADTQIMNLGTLMSGGTGDPFSGMQAVSSFASSAGTFNNTADPGLASLATNSGAKMSAPAV